MSDHSDAPKPHHMWNNLVAMSIADITFLCSARDGLITHPKLMSAREISDAASCRLLMSIVVTAVERVIEMWSEEPFLREYNSTRTTNGERLRLLRKCVEKAGVRVGEDTIEDYLAIKY